MEPDVIDKTLTTRPGWNHPPPGGVARARERNAECVTVLRPEEPLAFPPRMEIAPELRDRFPSEPGTVPEHFLVRLPKARVFSYHGVVIDDEDDVLTDLTHEFGRFAKGSRVCHYEALPPLEEVDARLLVLPSISCWKNYSHWILESVPRLRAMSPEDYDLALVPDRLPFHREWLDLLGIPESKRVPAKEETHIRATELVVPSPAPPGVIGRDGVEFLRRLAGVPALNEAVPGSRRLYVGRGDAWKRKVLNEDAVIEALRPFGFEAIELRGLSVVEQAQLFSGAGIIAAPHGAALANLAFCPPGTTVIECFPDQFVQPLYFSLGGVCGLDYFGHWTADDPSQWHFDLAIDSLIEIVKEVANSGGGGETSGA